MNMTLTAEAWAELAYIDFTGLSGLAAVRRLMKRGQIPMRADPESLQRVVPIIEAVQAASMLYVKPVLCLQRSAVTARLLRRRGIAADMVIGCHLRPFRAHAWVEVAGVIVGHEEDNIVYYRVLDRW